MGSSVDRIGKLVLLALSSMHVGFSGCFVGRHGEDDAGRATDAGDEGTTTQPLGTSDAMSDGTSDAMSDGSAGEAASTSGISDGTSTGEGEPAGCDGASMRVATYNVLEIGASESDSYEALKASVARISADVICMQEVRPNEVPQLEVLARDTGYRDLSFGEVTSPLAGSLINACMSRLPIVEFDSLNAADLSPDASANDLARDVLRTRVELSQTCHAALFTVHLKSGAGTTNDFRRQVEILRVVQALEEHRERHPEDRLFVLGDFNEEPFNTNIGAILSEVPADLPASYDLGADIELPLVYEPFETLRALGLELSEATHEDSETLIATRIPSGRRLDYLWSGGMRVDEDEVYDSCRDDGIDDMPAGNFTQKAGSPLPCGVSQSVSDHWPVFGDFVVR